MSNRMKRDLAIRALNMAIAVRPPPRGCIHHTDRGSQNFSHEYQKLLRQHRFKMSMSGKAIATTMLPSKRSSKPSRPS
jgi:transposase InsO family protein